MMPLAAMPITMAIVAPKNTLWMRDGIINMLAGNLAGGRFEQPGGRSVAEVHLVRGVDNDHGAYLAGMVLAGSTLSQRAAELQKAVQSAPAKAALCDVTRSPVTAVRKAASASRLPSAWPSGASRPPRTCPRRPRSLGS